MTLRRIARLPEPTGRGADFLNAYSYDGPLFHPNSVWNTPIPASAQVDANSANMMRTTIDGDGQGRTLGYAMSTHTNFHVSETSGGFSSRVWYADAETAAVVVKDRYGYTVTAGTPHPNSPIRIPSVATPASGSDGHMVVWDLVNHYVYEFWNALNNGDGTWSMGQNAKWLDYGNGYQPYTPHTLKPAARAFGGALMGGQIRYWELRRGYIAHALEYSYPWTANHNYAQGLGADGITENIAACTDGDLDTGILSVDTADQIPHGALIRLKASVDVDARAAGATHPATAATIGRCLQRFGARQVDRGGQPSFYAEDLTGKSVSYTGLLTTLDTSVFLPADFEVMAIPTVLQTRA
jgi:hypothetical protein